MFKAIQAKPITGMSSPADIRSQTISDWFDLLTEDYKKSLADINLHQGELTPFEAWHYAFGEFSSANCQCSACLLSLPARQARLCPPPAQQSQGVSVAAPAEVGQGLGTITCAACGSTNTEPCCHPAEFCQAICNDCNKPLNADGSVWVEKQEPTLEQFQRWLEDKAHAAHAEYFNGPQGETLSQEIERCRPITALLSRTRMATELLMQFKQELCA